MTKKKKEKKDGWMDFFREWGAVWCLLNLEGQLLFADVD